MTTSQRMKKQRKPQGSEHWIKRGGERKKNREVTTEKKIFRVGRRGGDRAGKKPKVKTVRSKQKVLCPTKGDRNLCLGGGKETVRQEGTRKREKKWVFSMDYSQ